MKKALLIILGCVLLAVSLHTYGCTQRRAGAKEATDRLEKAHARELMLENWRWLQYVGEVLDSVKADTVRASDAKWRANTRREQRAAVTPSTDWKARAEDLELEVVDLRVAAEAQQRALANLMPVVDKDTSIIGETTEALNLSLEREARLGKFSLGLGILVPKPPKWLAGVIGCAAGGALMQLIPTSSPVERAKNTALGCSAAAATLVIVGPTD